jgi:CTP:molybdopterin cytidylyltransferase MocA
VSVAGIVLAAGAGTRAGGPKALRRESNGLSWIELSAAALLEGGCERVIVVLGARHRLASDLVPRDPRVTIVVAADWAEGMSASLRAGLAAVRERAVLVTLVDLPGLPSTVVEALAVGATSAALRQATYNGRAGHPVLIGHDHIAGIIASLEGDRGARAYLVAHGVTEVECGALFDGEDRDLG